MCEYIFLVCLGCRVAWTWLSVPECIRGLLAVGPGPKFCGSLCIVWAGTKSVKFSGHQTEFFRLRAKEERRPLDKWGLDHGCVYQTFLLVSGRNRRKQK